LCSDRAALGDWIAGRDLALNEKSVLELTNPNGTVPEWSYGYRSTVTGIALTLFSAADHVNGASNIEGWALPDTLGPVVFVNAGDLGSDPVPHFSGFVAPHELLLHPRNNL